jgi:hypothetical protein
MLRFVMLGESIFTCRASLSQLDSNTISIKSYVRESALAS